MEIIIQPTPEAATSVAARVIMRQLRDKPDSVLGLATGSTSLLLYRALIGLRLEWDQVTTFNLDEYVGLAPDHPHSYHSFMRENLFRHVEIDPENIHIPGGMARDVPKFCALYEKEIKKAGGIDLQVLGIGTDGHIGFNEPTSSLASRTRIKTMTQQTRRDYSRFFGSEGAVPYHVITMGIGTIMDAKQIVLLAFGEQKAKAVAQAVEGPLTAICPASILQLHPTVKVFLDEAAASQLQRTEYYRWVFSNKPEWQRD